MPRSLLISTRPTFVEQILTGTKTVELRRKKPQLRPGATVYIYATAPVKAVVARAQLAGIVSLPPARLWEEVGEFFHYFAGCSIGHGLVLSSVEKLAEPVTMVELREYGIAVPQSWRYLPHRPGVTGEEG
ncbi:ASCH domain-containing protein [Corynebacterium glucuronolyticum]|uniref:ASCH domain-containing protein n=1 Tax=Corynebacterium glucuronolyticum TaxID=39791 RepID=UPI003F6DCD32